MAATASSFLLQDPTLRLKKHLYHSPQSPAHNSFAHLRVRIKSLRTLGVRCYFSPINNGSDRPYQDIGQKIGVFAKMETDNNRNRFELVTSCIKNALKALKRPAAAAVLVGLLLVHNPDWALAAGSGGRMGGSSFSSRSSTSSSSKSYSAPRSRSSLGSDSGFSYSVPYYAPSPFGGVFLGPAVGVGSSASLIFVAFVAFILVSGFLSEGSENSSVLTATEKTSVLKLQVGLLGLGRSLQKDLNRIAETADTSSSEGLHYVLTETVLALLRHPDYCISAYSSVDIKRNMEDGEKRFNQLSIEERGKFDEETLVNVNSMRKQSSTRLRASGFSNEYIVITILVAAEGQHKLPSINSSKDLKEALQKLASIPSRKTLAVEVLWTPQNEDDTLSERELLEDYPLLRPL
ncbi:hypothetical protein STAS_10809 [Striga asiatica]|uniref:Myelin-associated oligodendrocyte basic protein n=1 Tax=Striga asiatica TaxID=4170 RepID=A0A5A7PPK3_STRAF|nr:hypothetical protein STAS_10809 [Striga asiatica]